MSIINIHIITTIIMPSNHLLGICQCFYRRHQGSPSVSSCQMMPTSCSLTLVCYGGAKLHVYTKQKCCLCNLNVTLYCIIFFYSIHFSPLHLVHHHRPSLVDGMYLPYISPFSNRFSHASYHTWCMVLKQKW